MTGDLEVDGDLYTAMASLSRLDLELPLGSQSATLGAVEVRWREADSGRPVPLANGAATLTLPVKQR